MRYPLNAIQTASGSSIHYVCNTLLVASQHGHADVAQLLCGARTDIDKEFNDGATLLLVASQPN